MIFGQGATPGCHPYVLAEMEAAAMENQHEALERFDALLMGHMGYATCTLSVLFSALSG